MKEGIFELVEACNLFQNEHFYSNFIYKRERVKYAAKKLVEEKGELPKRVKSLLAKLELEENNYNEEIVAKLTTLLSPDPKKGLPQDFNHEAIDRELELWDKKRHLVSNMIAKEQEDLLVEARELLTRLISDLQRPLSERQPTIDDLTRLFHVVHWHEIRKIDLQRIKLGKDAAGGDEITKALKLWVEEAFDDEIVLSKEQSDRLSKSVDHITDKLSSDLIGGKLAYRELIKSKCQLNLWTQLLGWSVGQSQANFLNAASRLEHLLRKRKRDLKRILDLDDMAEATDCIVAIEKALEQYYGTYRYRKQLIMTDNGDRRSGRLLQGSFEDFQKEATGQTLKLVDVLERQEQIIGQEIGGNLFLGIYDLVSIDPELQPDSFNLSLQNSSTPMTPKRGSLEGSFSVLVGELQLKKEDPKYCIVKTDLDFLNELAIFVRELHERRLFSFDGDDQEQRSRIIAARLLALLRTDLLRGDESSHVYLLKHLTQLFSDIAERQATDTQESDQLATVRLMQSGLDGLQQLFSIAEHLKPTVEAHDKLVTSIDSLELYSKKVVSQDQEAQRIIVNQSQGLKRETQKFMVSTYESILLSKAQSECEDDDQGLPLESKPFDLDREAFREFGNSANKRLRIIVDVLPKKDSLWLKVTGTIFLGILGLISFGIVPGLALVDAAVRDIAKRKAKKARALNLTLAEGALGDLDNASHNALFEPKVDSSPSLSTYKDNKPLSYGDVNPSNRKGESPVPTREPNLFDTEGRSSSSSKEETIVKRDKLPSDFMSQDGLV